MQFLTVLRGYSGSGKSTWARQQEGAWIVSRDHIRQMLTHHDGKTTVGPDEDAVTQVELAQIRTLLAADKWVIVDNTNLKPAFARKYLNLAADMGVSWEVRDFTASATECQYRNAARENSVPAHVIVNQAKRHPMPWPDLQPGASHFAVEWEPYVPVPGSALALAVDIDGTLAHHEGVRGVFDTSKYLLDNSDPAVLRLVRHIAMWSGVVLFSGRSEDFRAETEAWLKKHNVPYSALYMRPIGDTRRDDLVKSDLLDAATEWNIWGAVDDRARVCRMWYARGIKVFRVGDPDAEEF